MAKDRSTGERSSVRSGLLALGLPLGLLVLAGALSSSMNCVRRTPDIRKFVQASTEERLIPFESEQALRTYAQAHHREMRRQLSIENALADQVPEAAAEAPAQETSKEESITNTQEAGVDEGGIVKTRGEHLVILRRGRLLTMRIGDDALTPISAIDAFPPGASTGGWYDEMLIHGDTIVVVGFSYARSATELGIFRIDEGGRLSHRETYFLRSNDYYSSRNYASRLIGDKLVFYMPYALTGMDGYSLPALARGQGDFDDIIDATEVYRPIQETYSPTLHTVVTCDLAAPAVRCNARGVIGPWSRTFYVAPEAVYLWVANDTEASGEAEGEGQATLAARDPRRALENPSAVVYRFPFLEGHPGAIRVSGAPVDQFSFKESTDGFLNVLVRAWGGGDAMWAPELTAGAVALLRLPVNAFERSVSTARVGSYANLPQPSGHDAFHNRFIGDHLLYGSGTGWAHPKQGREGLLFAHHLRGAMTERIALPHGVDRIEPLGRSAVVIGTDGKDLHFSSIALGAVPAVAGSYIQESASQGEQRSHGFFYKPQQAGDGLLGLPIRGAGRPGYEHLFHGSAKVLFLKVEDEKEFSKLGALGSSAQQRDDRCVASCVDWYGNARPIFYRGRVFALLGYELVEGELRDGALHERRRANFLDALGNKR